MHHAHQHGIVQFAGPKAGEHPCSPPGRVGPSAQPPGRQTSPPKDYRLSVWRSCWTDSPANATPSEGGSSAPRTTWRSEQGARRGRSPSAPAGWTFYALGGDPLRNADRAAPPSTARPLLDTLENRVRFPGAGASEAGCSRRYPANLEDHLPEVPGRRSRTGAYGRPPSTWADDLHRFLVGGGADPGRGRRRFARRNPQVGPAPAGPRPPSWSVIFAAVLEGVGAGCWGWHTADPRRPPARNRRRSRTTNWAEQKARQGGRCRTTGPSSNSATRRCSTPWPGHTSPAWTPLPASTARARRREGAGGRVRPTTGTLAVKARTGPTAKQKAVRLGCYELLLVPGRGPVAGLPAGRPGPPATPRSPRPGRYLDRAGRGWGPGERGPYHIRPRPATWSGPAGDPRRPADRALQQARALKPVQRRRPLSCKETTTTRGNDPEKRPRREFDQAPAPGARIISGPSITWAPVRPRAEVDPGPPKRGPDLLPGARRPDFVWTYLVSGLLPTPSCGSSRTPRATFSRRAWNWKAECGMPSIALYVNRGAPLHGVGGGWRPRKKNLKKGHRPEARSLPGLPESGHGRPQDARTTRRHSPGWTKGPGAESASGRTVRWCSPTGGGHSLPAAAA